MGFGHRGIRRDGPLAQYSRSSTAADQRRWHCGFVGEDWAGRRPADAGGRRCPCRLESARADGGVEPVSGVGNELASAAGVTRPAIAARLYDATEVAAANFRLVWLAHQYAAGRVSPLSRQRVARAV